jgi:zinc and cadmium transporter
MHILIWVLIATIVDGLISLVGVFSLWIKEKTLQKILFILVAFSAGALLSGAFFHLLPEALENMESINVFVFVIIGFILFFLIEKFLHWHHCHNNEKCDVHPFTYLILIGDGVHNFLDGLIIATSFFVSIPFGIITTLIILGHELPQELGDFGVLVYGGFSRTKALLFNLLSQLTAVIGGIIGYLLSTFVEGIVSYVLPFAAGGFIYIAASDLIPELHKEPELKKSLTSFTFFLFGIAIMFSLKIIFGH